MYLEHNAILKFSLKLEESATDDQFTSVVYQDIL